MMVDHPILRAATPVHLHVVLELAEPWLLLTELAQLQRVSKACVLPLPPTTHAVDRSLLRCLFANRQTLDVEALPLRGLAVWERLAWRTHAARAAKRVKIIGGRAAGGSKFCSHREAHAETEPLHDRARLFGGRVLLCDECVESMAFTGINDMIVLFGLSKNAIRRRFPRLAYQPSPNNSKAMLFPLDLMSSPLVAQALVSSRKLREQAVVADDPARREYLRVVPHCHAALIRRVQSHPVMDQLIQVNVSKGDGIDVFEWQPGPGKETRRLRADERADIKRLVSYITTRLNLPMAESMSKFWLAETTSSVMDQLETRSPPLVQLTTRTRIRQALLGLLRYRELGIRFRWRQTDETFTPNRWAFLTELLTIFLGLPKGGCRGWEARAIMFHSPTRSRFRWVVPDAKPTRKRKRKDP
jgi:hypothetical protein